MFMIKTSNRANGIGQFSSLVQNKQMIVIYEAVTTSLLQPFMSTPTMCTYNARAC